jgi:hypothetical protein
MQKKVIILSRVRKLLVVTIKCIGMAEHLKGKKSQSIIYCNELLAFNGSNTLAFPEIVYKFSVFSPQVFIAVGKSEVSKSLS